MAADAVERAFNWHSFHLSDQALRKFFDTLGHLAPNSDLAPEFATIKATIELRVVIQRLDDKLIIIIQCLY